MRREFLESQPELMDLPNPDSEALRKDLEHISRLNGTFGARRAVAELFHRLTLHLRRVVLVDLASGYGDHARNLTVRARARQVDVAVIALDSQLKTLQIARSATPPDHKVLYVQADARQLPLRTKQADLVFCSLALHHFSEEDALTVLREMTRVGRIGSACIDLVRSRLAAIGIWLLTTFIVRDPMVKHDARVSIRRAFTTKEMQNLAQRAGWPRPEQTQFFWFQQAILGRTSEGQASA